MEKKLFAFGMVLFAFAIFSATAHAIPIVNQPLDPAGYGFTSMYGSQNILEDFRLSSQTNITAVWWYGLFSSGTAATDQSVANFDVLFFLNDNNAELTTTGGISVSGLPMYQPFYETTLSAVKGTATGFGDPLHGGTIFRWETNILEVVLEAGRYWIDIRSSSVETSFFLWSHSASEDGYSVYRTLPASFIPPSDLTKPFWIVSDELYDEQAFGLHGTPGPAGTPVAEPATIILLGTGLIGIFGCRNRKFMSR